MYIRIKNNVSGSKTVMLVQSERLPGKKNSTGTLVKNFGTSKDPDVIANLKKQAQAYKKQFVAINPKVNFLTIKQSSDIAQSKIINTAFHDIYGKIFDSIAKNFKISAAQRLLLLRDVCILRVATPASKLKTSHLAHKFGCNFSVDSVYKMMDKIDDTTINNIKLSIASKSKQLLHSNNVDLDILFYDLTTIYFETNNKDDLRQFGFSKDGKSQHVQITLALLVSNLGLPIGYEIFPGNMYEGHTLNKAVEQLSQTYSINNIVIVADSGLISKNNLNLLEEKGYNYIIAARLKSFDKETLKDVLDVSNYIQTTSEGISSYKKSDFYDGRDLHCYYSDKKRIKDEKERETKLTKLLNTGIGKNAKTGLSSKFRQAYVKVKGNAKIEIDEEILAEQKKFDGLFCLITNKKDLTSKMILQQYKGLWQIERSFRTMKSEISIRPVYHWTVGRLKAHFVICYIAFALSRYVQFKMEITGKKVSSEKIIEALGECKSNLIIVGNKSFSIQQDMPETAKAVYKVMRKARKEKFLVH